MCGCESGYRLRNQIIGHQRWSWEHKDTEHRGREEAVGCRRKKKGCGVQEKEERRLWGARERQKGGCGVQGEKGGCGVQEKEGGGEKDEEQQISFLMKLC